jgi:hypothetical protein
MNSKWSTAKAGNFTLSLGRLKKDQFSFKLWVALNLFVAKRTTFSSGGIDCLLSGWSLAIFLKSSQGQIGSAIQVVNAESDSK